MTLAYGLLRTLRRSHNATWRAFRGCRGAALRPWWRGRRLCPVFCSQVNAADYDARTCLHLAASVGQLKIVEYLIQAGANINAADRMGGTPLRDAVRERRAEVGRLLRKPGC